MKVINSIIFAVFATQETLSQSRNNNYDHNPFLRRVFGSNQVSQNQVQSYKPTDQYGCFKIDSETLRFQNEVKENLSVRFGINLQFSEEVLEAGKNSGTNMQTFKYFLNKDGFKFTKMGYYGVFISGSYCEDYESTINNIVGSWGNQFNKTDFNGDYYAVIKQNKYWNLFVAKKYHALQSKTNKFNKHETVYEPVTISSSKKDNGCQVTSAPSTSFDIRKVFDLINTKRALKNSNKLMIDPHLKQTYQNFKRSNQKTYRKAYKFTRTYTYKNKVFTQTFCDGIPMSFFPILDSWSTGYWESLMDPRFTHFTIDRNGDEWTIIAAF